MRARDRSHPFLDLSDIVEDADRGPHHPPRHDGDAERDPGGDGDVPETYASSVETVLSALSTQGMPNQRAAREARRARLQAACFAAPWGFGFSGKTVGAPGGFGGVGPEWPLRVEVGFSPSSFVSLLCSLMADSCHRTDK
ncbi:MAG TPA: hypothetical protein VIJ63_05650 [Roseiarcus sp.]